jgi:RNA polymerase sigma-70 factor (ECF subfamily)
VEDTGRSHEADAALAVRIRSGDREALGELYDRYAAVALGVALRVVRDRDAAEDVVHDAFVAVWQKISRFDPQQGQLRSWLLTVVRNRAIDRVRGARAAEDIDALDELGTLRSSANPTWEAAVANLSLATLRGALGSLPGEQREAVELAYFGGHTYREVAVLTGVPPGTAAGRLRLALAKLRQLLTGTDAGPGGLPPSAESSAGGGPA